jgi:hypothetical protein
MLGLLGLIGRKLKLVVIVRQGSQVGSQGSIVNIQGKELVMLMLRVVMLRVMKLRA